LPAVAQVAGMNWRGRAAFDSPGSSHRDGDRCHISVPTIG